MTSPDLFALAAHIHHLQSTGLSSPVRFGFHTKDAIRTAIQKRASNVQVAPEIEEDIEVGLASPPPPPDILIANTNRSATGNENK
jgi:hypothetical protein